MKLLKQLLAEAGADTSSAFTVVPQFGGYFKQVARVEEYTPQKIVISAKKCRTVITGEGLKIEKYFEKDLFVRGSITGVSLDRLG